MPLPGTNLGMGALLWPVLSLSVAKQLLTTFVLPRTIQSHFCLNYWTKCFGKGHGSCHWGFESRRITHAWHTWFIMQLPFHQSREFTLLYALIQLQCWHDLDPAFYSKKYLKIRNFCQFHKFCPLPLMKNMVDSVGKNVVYLSMRLLS